MRMRKRRRWKERRTLMMWREGVEISFKSKKTQEKEEKEVEEEE